MNGKLKNRNGNLEMRDERENMKHEKENNDYGIMRRGKKRS